MSEHTPGPWRWFINTKIKQVYLATPDRGRLIVMNLERWGMQDAKPRFRDDKRCVMVPLEDLITVDHNSNAVEIDHPDARLMAAAPDLLKACKYAFDLLHWEDLDSIAGAYLQQAIAKAEGRSDG